MKFHPWPLSKAATNVKETLYTTLSSKNDVAITIGICESTSEFPVETSLHLVCVCGSLQVRRLTRCWFDA